MKLTKVRITNFQSIQDTTEFDIGNVTCLVGKNEAGKTALLKALYRLNPITEEDSHYDVTYDYPRRTMIDYEDAIDTGEDHAEVVQATYTLEPEDINIAKEFLEPEYLENKVPTITLRKGYANKLFFSGLGLNELVIDSSEFVDNDLNEDTEGNMYYGISTNAKDTFDKLVDRIPKFLYFDEYYQMKGQDNIEGLIDREKNKNLNESDYPLLGLINLAGLQLEQILETRQTESLIARLEAAGNSLTENVLPYWSQNQHLRMKFEIRPGQPEDPEGMTSGTNIWGRVEDTKHYVTTSLGTRSRGFVWFFSFLAWYNDLRKKYDNLILLLDEPGLFLHAKAQGDLLLYFEEKLATHHQLVYTTHSPFMVDPSYFERVRIVQNLSIEADSNNLPNEQQGTKVITEVLDAIPDSLFPLQGALGYEISQTLFIGPNSLVVEGVSDLLYIQTVSALLQRRGKTGLSPNWTITPVGGSDKVSTFVSLIGAQPNLNIAVLIDYQKKDQQKIENLYKTKLLKQNQVLTYVNFVKGSEADIEDMFDPDFYLNLVNLEFETSLTIDDLPKGLPRIIRRLEEYFADNPLSKNVKFNHYRPALYFSQNIQSLEIALTESQFNRFQEAFDVLNKLLDS